MPADILRDREGGDATESGDLRPAPATTPGAGVPYFLQRPGFADLTDSLTDQLAAKRREIDAARAERAKAVEAEGAALQRRADAMRPPIEAARTALEAPRPAPPVPPGLAPAPSRKLTDFLAPVAGESPENTITKLIQGIGLMAAGITGLKHGDARAALAGLRGALAGWQEGDKQRADRAFADWESASKSLIGDWERRHKVYRDLLEDQKLTVDQKLEAVKLKALEEGHQVAVETFNRQRVDDAVKFLQDDLASLEALQLAHDRLAQQKATSEMQADLRRDMMTQQATMAKERLEQSAAQHKASMDLRREIAEGKRDDLKPTPTGELNKVLDNAIARSYIAAMTELSGKIDLNKIAGGVRPWINQLIQRWGGTTPPPTGTTAGAVPRGKMALSEDEQRFLALMQDYADVILRQRSGAAISEGEMRRMLGFVPDQSLSPQTIQARLRLAHDLTLAKDETMRQALNGAGYRFPEIKTVPIGERKPISVEGWKIEPVR